MAAESARTTLAECETLAGKAARKGKRTRGKTRGDSPADFSDGPPCLQTLALQGVAPGGQNNALLMMGVYYKRVSPDGWRGLLERANRELLRPPGSPEGLASVMRSLEKKDYEYTCKAEPMCSVCDAALCRTRKFGVGDGSGPRIIAWRKITADEPIWFVKVEGSETEMEIKRVDDLTNPQRFADQCAKQLDLFFAPPKRADWARHLAEAKSFLVPEAPPTNTSRAAQFRELLEEFLTNRSRGERREDLLRGAPFENEESGFFEFRVNDLQRFLVREKFPVERGEIWQRVKKLGGDHGVAQGEGQDIARVAAAARRRTRHASARPAPAGQ